MVCMYFMCFMYVMCVCRCVLMYVCVLCMCFMYVFYVFYVCRVFKLNLPASALSRAFGFRSAARLAQVSRILACFWAGSARASSRFGAPGRCPVAVRALRTGHIDYVCVFPQDVAAFPSLYLDMAPAAPPGEHLATLGLPATARVSRVKRALQDAARRPCARTCQSVK